MDFIVVSPNDGVIGELSVNESCNTVTKRVIRSLFVRKIVFEEGKSWGASDLQDTINSHGRQAGGHHWKDIAVLQSSMPAGCFHPRIARPTAGHPADPPITFGISSSDLEEFQQATMGVRTLFHSFMEIAQVIHPTGANLDGYGSSIRNLLILACTEFEATAKSVLRENGYQRNKTNIEDYNKLEQAMRLSQYKVELQDFPEIGALQPFREWGSKQSLAWYKAYNNAKHDRHLNFSKASLRHALDALLGNYVLMVASYGWQRVRENLVSIPVRPKVCEFPVWELGEMYRRAEFAVGSLIEAREIQTPIKYSFGER